MKAFWKKQEITNPQLKIKINSLALAPLKIENVVSQVSLVSFVKIEEGAEIKKGILDALDLIQYKLPADLKSIVIKPNMCYYWDHTTGQTTDPKFVLALVHILREKTAATDIAIVESDASAMKCKYVFSLLGYKKLFEDQDVRLINLSDEKSEAATITCGGQSHEFMVPQVVKNADLRINLPKIKYTMKGIDLSCALKNIYGCNPYPLKFKYHQLLEKVIVSLNKAMKFDLCIIDGNVVSGIAPRKLGLVMASKDPVAIDVAAAKIAGLNPQKIKYLKLASQEGLGLMHFIPIGEPLNYFRALYPKKTLKRKLMGQAYVWAFRLRLAKRLGIA